EDGIRDKLVTGVQTCALPIFLGLQGLTGVFFFAVLEAPAERNREGIDLHPSTSPLFVAHFPFPPDFRAGRRLGSAVSGVSGSGRSEERRVGKGGRAGWVRGE